MSSAGMRIWQPDTYKDRVRQLFDRRAPTYDDSPRFHKQVAGRCLHHARLQEGHRVLDLACGTGHLTFAACEAVGPGGWVVGLDISQPMLQQAEEKARARGLQNLTLVAADAEEHAFPPASFNRVLAANAVPYFQRYKETFSRIRSWLAPGGLFVFSTPQTPMFQATDTLNELAGELFGIHMCDAAGDVGDRAAAARLLTDAGFSGVQVNAEEEVYTIPATPEGFAERMWSLEPLKKGCRLRQESFPMCPLDHMLDAEQLHRLRAAYLPAVAEQGRALQRGPNIVNPYVSFYIVAEA